MLMPFDHPALIVEFRPGDERATQFLDRRKRSDPQQLLLERANGALGAAVSFGRAHERRARLDAKEGDFLLERIAHVLAAMVVPQLQAAGDVARDRPEVFAYALADRFQ